MDEIRTPKRTTSRRVIVTCKLPTLHWNFVRGRGVRRSSDTREKAQEALIGERPREPYGDPRAVWPAHHVVEHVEVLNHMEHPSFLFHNDLAKPVEADKG